MGLEPGRQVAHYRVLEKIGEGGMGEVYAAEDTRLNRKVALKLLPETFAHDAERMARFAREAQLLASLSHANIGSIYGLEHAGAARCLVLELIEGPTLEQRLAQGALPLDEALGIARQIAEGLEAAHESGVVHRDLKPANVKLTPDGTVKILDFGLAKALAGDLPSGSVSTSPTITSAATQTGVILGTAAYMSPEQAKGLPVDRRADVWAFGVVLYELLAGQRPFRADSVSETLAAVLMAEPDLATLPADTPPPIRRLVERCLDKDVRRRLQAIGEVRIAIDDYLADPSGAAQAPAAGIAPARASRLPWIVAALLGLGLLGTAWTLWPTAPERREVVRLRAQVGTGLELASNGGAAAVLSPDGTLLAYTANDDTVTRLYLRRMNQLEGTPLLGTEGATAPFFSPDGKWVGFFTNRQLMKVSISGGAPLALAETQENRGGTWSQDGTIVYSPHIITGLMRIPAGGGTPEPLTELAEGERSHRWPRFLPDGEHVLFIAQDFNHTYDDSSIEVVNVHTRARTVVHEGGTYPSYVPTGHLAYVRGGTLFLAPMDPGRRVLTGTAVPAVQGVLFSADSNTGNGTAHYAFADNGTLVYVEGQADNPDSRIVWYDEAGQESVLVDQERAYYAPRLSPDGERLAVHITDDATTDLWVYDIGRAVMTRLTFDGMSNMLPVWTADGERLLYSVNEGNATKVFSLAADGSEPPRLLLEDQRFLTPTSTSPDGHVAIHVQNQEGGWDVETVRVVDGEALEPEPFVATSATDVFAQFSPDGRWVAYLSNESGQWEVYVRPFPGPGGKWQVSTAGGHAPRWAKGGRELIYRDEQGWNVVPIEVAGASLRLGRARQVPDPDYVLRPPFPTYDIAADGRRLLALKVEGAVDRPGLTHLSFVFQWFDEVRGLEGDGGG